MTDYIYWLIFPNSGFWDISDSDLEQYKRQESHRFIFSIDTNYAWAGIRTSNLIEEPYRAQSDAFGWKNWQLWSFSAGSIRSLIT